MFSIARYQGDEDEQQPERTFEKKQERLQELREKANRKRKTQTPSIDSSPQKTTTAVVTTASDNDESNDKKRHKKTNDSKKEEKKQSKEEPVMTAMIVTAEKEEEAVVEEETDAAATAIPNEDVDTSQQAQEEQNEGIMAFPDFRQKYTEKSKDEVALLRNMGIPDWLLYPTIINPSDTCPIDNFAGISDRLKKRCLELGISRFFAVQMAVVPVFLRRQALYDTRKPPGDLCVSAPTGSGKTISYVLPIIDILSKRVVTRLRALVVLPTRELAIQVKETFDAFTKGTNLKVGAAIGQNTFRREQQVLVGKHTDKYRGGQSEVDILVATPGRLTEHLKETPNFTLQHLRFLVIDEADQLLGQSFNDWLNQILAATRPQPCVPGTPLTFKKDNHGVFESDSIAPYFLNSFFDLPRTDVDLPKAPTVQKLLFSATLTKNPAKIAGLHLTEPEYISVQRQKDSDAGTEQEYTTPEGLKEFMIVTTTDHKPLVLLYILHQFNIKSCLCFTRSAESTAQLKLLVEAFEAEQTRHGDKLVVSDYSGDLPVAQRKALLEKFQKGDVNVLICSDLIGRGIDLDNVDVVINYDVPWFMDKYIHRVGRTARAGREGQAYSLVENQEARGFKDMMRKAGHYQQIKMLKADKNKLVLMDEDYQNAMSKLQQ